MHRWRGGFTICSKALHAASKAAFDGDSYVEEGGPKALLECMATGVPLISTRVGMAPGVVKNNDSRMTVDVEDVNGIVEAASQMIGDTDRRIRVAEHALHTVRDHGLPVVVRRYYDRVYAPLMKD